MTKPVAVRGGHFSVAGHQLAYELYGDAGTPCVLVHGILLDSLLNRDLAVRFAAAGYQVALLDLLGHGHSAKPNDPKEHRVDFYADQLLALMDHLGWERALIGGISLGAMTSITAAAKAPERVIGLFLEMPVMEWSAPWAAVILAPMLVATRYGGLLYRRFARLMARLPRPRSAWMASGMNAFSADPRIVAAILHGVLVGPMVPPVAVRRTLQMPTLIIGHWGDKLHEYRDARALAQQLPNARLLSAKHILELRTQPSRLWPEIARFLDQVRTASPAPHAATRSHAAGPAARRRRSDH
ncbi:MAG: alpha/beta fold hydrolase [Sinimarinibacterium sp.]|jgi:pimeloyl-ACP methyl ester carboxylesterase